MHTTETRGVRREPPDDTPATQVSRNHATQHSLARSILPRAEMHPNLVRTPRLSAPTSRILRLRFARTCASSRALRPGSRPSGSAQRRAWDEASRARAAHPATLSGSAGPHPQRMAAPAARSLQAGLSSEH
eukprot:5617448-Prymnesium_polylepis.1